MRAISLNSAGIFLGILVLAGTMFALLFGGLWLTKPAARKSGTAGALFTVIAAPSPTLTAAPTAALSPPPTLSNLPTPPSPNIVSGAYVQIVGTGGDGLRLREEPGLGNTILTLASEAEIFQVLEGPRDADGYVWWYISDPYNETRRGWSATNYLLVVQNP